MALKRNDETDAEFEARLEAESLSGLALPIPCRLEDEKYVISLALYFPGCGEEIAAKLDPEDFHSQANRLVFDAIRALAERGETITVHNVYQFTLDTADGDPFNVATPFELKAMYDKQHFDDTRGLMDAIKRLKDYAKLRAIIEAAKTASRLAYEAKTRPEEIIGVFAEAERIISRTNQSVVEASQATQEALEIYGKLNRGEIVCIPSGLPELDRLLYGGGFWQGDNVVIAGETSTGKTTFALNLMINACLMGFRCLYFSLEMKRFKVISRIHSNLARVPNWKIRPNMDELSGQGITERLSQTIGRVSDLKFKVDDTTNRVDDIARVARYEVKNNGVDMVIVDYAGLCRPPRGFRGSAYERATEVSRVLTETPHDLGIPFLNVYQLRRMVKDEITRNKDKGKDANEPGIEMLKDSGAVENDADTIALVMAE
jgi:replicative DNA helicase